MSYAKKGVCLTLRGNAQADLEGLVLAGPWGAGSHKANKSEGMCG